MNLILPIVIAALLIGALSRRNTPGLWAIMATVIIASAVYFSLRH